MNLYYSSIFVIALGIIIVTPLTVEKNIYKYSLPLFYLIIFLTNIFRPYVPEAIDNSTFIEILNNDVLEVDRLKYTLIYFLTRLIPGTWEKIYLVNILSSSLLLL